jgi:ferric-dicitrate binding protein FerR (iron transport regulator)
MIPEDTPMNIAPTDGALERAIAEIGGEAIPDAVVDRAAERVWRRIAGHIGDCSGFRELFEDYRAGRLPEERALLVKDHLRECVGCRKAFHGVEPRTAPGIKLPQERRTGTKSRRWAIAAGIVLVGGVAGWFAVFQYGSTPGRAVVRSIDGTLYEVSAAGLRVMAPGEALPDGMEIRTARDSRASIGLRDGSLAEMRERSDLSTSGAGGEITLHLDRGSVIVQAAHRRSGHLYVATADCRVAVKGTLFSVSAGVKGSRVSVVEGEVSVSRENRQTLLHPGDQLSTSDVLEPLPVREDLGWSHNRRLLGALALLRQSLPRVASSQVRYQSRLLELLPASTVFYSSIPNLSGYFAEAQNVFREKSAENAELRAWLAGPGASIEPMLERLRAFNEYLGDEIVVFGTEGAPAPVMVAEVKRPGFEEFFRGAELPLAMEMRGDLVLLSSSPKALAITLDSSFRKTEFYRRIVEAYGRGAGLLWCADLMRMPPAPGPRFLPGKLPGQPPHLGGHYLIAEQMRVADNTETRASLGFDGARQGMAAWLAKPAPIGAMDYITPDATLAAAFTVTDPAAVLDQVSEAIAGLRHDRSEAGRDGQSTDIRRQIAASMGGEFAIALDGSPLPVPSWKLVAEVNDPARFETGLEKWVAAYNQAAAATGSVPLRTSREMADGRAWYLLGWGQPNPLSEAHYTFSSGYLIAAPTRPLVERALETSVTGISLARSQPFTSLLPHDSYTDFSAVMYQNIGTALAPFAAMLGAKGPDLTHLKPLLVTAYAEPQRITLASTGDLLGISFNNFLSGSLFGIAKDVLPMAGLGGTNRRENSSR